MDTWPPTIVCNSTQGEKNHKGKVKATLLPYPLLEGGALTSATLREDGNRFEWVTAQNQTSGRKLVCNKNPVLAFPATQSPQLRPRTTSLLQRAEQGAHFLRTYYPDVDIPAELIREQVGVEAQLEDSLRVFDPLVGDLVASFHVAEGSKRPWSFIAFPMGESGCDLNFSSVDFSAEGNIITEPSHYPVKTFETPICQIVSSVSSDLSKETVVGVRTFSSTSLSSLSLSTPKKRKTTTFVDTKEIDSINSSSLNGHKAADVQIHSSLEYAALVNDQGHVFKHSLLGGTNPVKVFGDVSGPDGPNDGFWRIALGEHKETCFLMSSKSAQLIDFRAAERGVKVYSVSGTSDLLTSIKSVPDDGLSRFVTTTELVWVDSRFHIRPILAWKHERERDRTLSSHAVGIGGATFTVLSSGKNCLLSVYDVFSDKNSLVQSHALPYSLSGRFPNGPHAGFYITHPHPESGNATTASLVQLTSRGAVYQTALALGQNEDETPSPVTIDVSWSSAVHQLATASGRQRPDVGKLGARSTQEVDFRQVYQRLFSPLDAAEAVYPAENASAVYQTLDIMPLFWQEASPTHEHLLTTFDIAFRSGEEPTHPSRADFLTQSALSSKRGFRALAQGRVPRDILIKGAAWYANLEPVLQNIVPDLAEDIRSIAERLRQYDLVLDDYRSGSSLRRESEAREQLAVDLALSTDVYSTQSFTKTEAEVTEDEKFETMSRAAEAMTLEPPSVDFGYLSPIPVMTHSSPDIGSTSLALPPGVRLLLSEWITGTDPDQYAHRDPYDDKQPEATTFIHRTPMGKNGRGRDGSQARQSQPIATAAPPVVAHSRTAPLTVISSSQPVTRHVAGSEDEPDSCGPVASTQVVPGPYGGRSFTPRKKAGPVKKRAGGF